MSEVCQTNDALRALLWPRENDISCERRRSVFCVIPHSYMIHPPTSLADDAEKFVRKQKCAVSSWVDATNATKRRKICPHNSCKYNLSVIILQFHLSSAVFPVFTQQINSITQAYSLFVSKSWNDCFLIFFS